MRQRLWHLRGSGSHGSKINLLTAVKNSGGILLQELKLIARGRLDDAQALLNQNRYDGAVYLCGYAVELGLKYRICRTLKWTAFPLTNGEFRTKNSLKTHEVNDLLQFSGKETLVRTTYLAEWSIVERWNSESRYNSIGTITQAQAREMIQSSETLLRVLLK